MQKRETVLTRSDFLFLAFLDHPTPIPYFQYSVGNKPQAMCISTCNVYRKSL